MDLRASGLNDFSVDGLAPEIQIVMGWERRDDRYIVISIGSQLFEIDKHLFWKIKDNDRKMI